MSTKTSIKRIAAVAAVALTLGGFSAVSAHAGTSTTQGDALAISSATATTTAGVATSAVVSQSFLAGTGDDTMTVTASILSMPAGNTALPSWDSVTATGYTDANVTFNSASKTVSGLVAKTGKDANSKYTAANYKIKLTPTVAGTYVIKLTPGFANDTVTVPQAAAVTWTVTVGAAVVGKSTAYIAAGTAAADSTSDAGVATTPISGVYSGTAAVAHIAVIQYADALGTTALSTSLTQAVVVSLTGSGLLSLGSTTTPSGRALAVAAGSATTPSSSATQDFYVFPDGTSGVGTITVSVGGVVIATKTVTFYGKAAKATATAKYSVLSTAGATKSSAALVSVTDAAGNPVSGLTSANFTATSSDTTVVASSTALPCVEDTVTPTPGLYLCDVTSVAGSSSGKSATLTINVVSGTTVLATAAPITFTLGGTTISSLSLAFGAATYAAGDKATLTLTAKDSAGNPVADGYYAVFSAASTVFAGLASSASTTTAPFAIAADATTGVIPAGTKFTAGVASATVYAPSVAGTWTESATTIATAPFSTAIQTAGGVALTASATLTSAAADAAQAAVDAANEATDAANAATDAANNAMDSADAAQQAALDAGDKADAALAAVTDLATKVSAIASQIAALSALVKKIAAKVKA